MRPPVPWAAVAALGMAACLPRSLPTPSGPTSDFEYQQEVQTFDLANGAHVGVLPEAGANLVEIDLRYQTGSADDPPGKEGLAHLVEHLTFSLRDGPDAPTFGDRLAALTLDFNAYTNWDETHYVEVAPLAALPRLIGLERERFAPDCAHIDDEILDRERDVVIQELLQRNDTGGRMAAALFGDHPYGRQVGGTPASLRSITRDDVCRFLTENYAPSRAIIVVSGAIDGERVRRILIHTLGTLPAREASTPVPVPPMAPGPLARLALPVDRPTALIAFPGATPVGKDGAELSVLLEVMRRRLAAHDEISSVSVLRVGGDRAPAAVFAITPARPRELDQMPDRFFAEAADLHEHVDEIELEWAKTRRRVQLLTATESLPSKASRVADDLQYDRSYTPLYHELAVIQDVGVDAISRIANGLLRRDRARVILARPEPSGAVPAKPGELAETHEHDVAIWREPVDPARARAPMWAPWRPTVTQRRELTLDNGLRVILISGLAGNLVDIRLLVPTGYNDVPDAPGIPLLAANLIGVPDLRRYRMQDNVAFYDVFKRAGERDVEVSDHWTKFAMRGLSTDVGVLLWQILVPLTDGVYHQRALSDLPGWIAGMPGRPPTDDEMRQRLLSGKGSQRQKLLASIEHVRAADLRRFAARHYRAAGATLVVAGHFDPDRLAKEVRRLFDRLPAGDAAQSTTASSRDESSLPAARDVAVVRPAAVQLRASLSFPIPAKMSPRRAAAFAVARKIIERRAQVLREGMGVTYGVAVDAETVDDQPVLTVRARLATTAAPHALAVLEAQLGALRAGRDIDADVVRARRRLVARLLVTAADSGAAADEAEAEVVYQHPAHYEDLMLRAVAGVTRTDVAKALAQMLAPTHEMRLLIGTHASIAAGFRALGAKHVSWQQ